jgi:hypothetical protein
MGAATLALTNARAPRTGVKSATSGTGTFGIGTVTMSSSYATGGDTGDWGTIGVIGNRDDTTGKAPNFVFLAPSAGYVPVWDATNKKVIVYQQSAATGALTQVANTTDLHTVVFNALIFW